MYGLEMVRASSGKLKRGSIYVTLTRMEDKTRVTSNHTR
jgi:DNA-binding PadR family transcriptional regulator